MLGIVPFVEFALVLGRNIHPDQHQRRGLARRRAIAWKQLLALVGQDALAEFGSPFGPG